jgi:HAE1 family hydrophobic/amphiphilic exporter-1
LVEAAIQGATIRLRPILMTSLAFILGVVPLVIATGAGENGRHSVGTTVFGGMIMSTFLNLIFIPVLYLIIEGWRERGGKRVHVPEPAPPAGAGGAGPLPGSAVV